jgi:hypothetical protein
MTGVFKTIRDFIRIQYLGPQGSSPMNIKRILG